MYTNSTAYIICCLQAVGPVAVTSLLLGANLSGIIDAPIQDDPNNPHNQHAQDLYNHAAIQVKGLYGQVFHVAVACLMWMASFEEATGIYCRTLLRLFSVCLSTLCALEFC